MRLELDFHHLLRGGDMCGGDNCDEAKWAHEYASAGGSGGDVEWASMIVVMSTLSSLLPARLVAEMKPLDE